MAPSSRRRVSYVIPPPAEPPPRLQLPPHGVLRHGAIGPLLARATTGLQEETTPNWAYHPRHRLGVTCLALDTSTQLVGRSSPGGILYSGGRDGLICSWDMDIPMRRRERRYGAPSQSMRRGAGRWEILTGWTDDIIEEELEEEEYRSAGDILGEVKGSTTRGRFRRQSLRDQPIPLEQQWETDIDIYEGGKTSQFRQCAQVHSDWINDILLCNSNQTLVTASSDGTVKSWNPHSFSDPSTIGTHADYVRCLAHSREQKWVASGSFDRTIKLWDLGSPPSLSNDPLITLHPPEAAGLKSSIYALATDASGSVVVSGSPERVIRMWDPRSGKRVGKFVGHTDNIRAILISDDARYMLTGSADASIKLWSLSSQRCLHTFTHHTESVWSLYSAHPSLEVFYSGDRSGLVCKVDVEGCSDISEGECIVLCQDSGEHSLSSTEGINKIVAMDDNLLWTAAGSSSIKRWRVPTRRNVRATMLGNTRETESSTVPEIAPDYPSGRKSAEFARSRSPHRSLSNPSSPRKKAHRASVTPSISGSVLSENSVYNQDKEGEETWYGIPFESLVKLISPNETFTTPGMARGRDPEIATLYSAASIMSVPRVNRSPFQTAFRNVSPLPGETPLARHTEETLHPMKSARVEYEEREVAADAVPLYTIPDDIIHGDHGLVRSVILNDRIHALTVNTAGEVAVWDIVRGVCLGKYSSEDVAAASLCGSLSGRSGGSEEKGYSPREAIEAVRERIEGEAVVLPWATVDTKTGVLSVHLNERCFEAEIYADEAGYGPERPFADDLRLNIGKWVLKNLFYNFIKEQQRATRRNKDPNSQEVIHRLQRGSAPTHIDINAHASAASYRSSSDAPRTPHSANANANPKSPIVITSSNFVPAASPLIGTIAEHSPSPNATSPSFEGRSIPLSPIPQSPNNDATPMPRLIQRSATTDGSNIPASTTPSIVTHSDYFSLRDRTPSSGDVVASPDDFSGWSGPGNAKPGTSAQATTPVEVPQTPTTPSTGGFMGRLRAFGKVGKRQASEIGTASTSPATGSEPIVSVADDSSTPVFPKAPLQVLLSQPLTPPSSTEAPPLSLPSNTTVIISQESASGWTTLHRGFISDTGRDANVLAKAMPLWLLEYLLTNKVPPIPVTKISFVLLPYPGKDGAETLPELLNRSQSKLTASRFLRVRKLTHHVQDKLDKIMAGRASAVNSAVNTPRSSFDARLPSRNDGRPRPEDSFEILCNDVLLPLDMTLAAVRQFIWRSSGELVMYYRRRVTTGDTEIQTL